MSKIYVSLGSNCEPALRLRVQGKRMLALPFDWVVAFGNITKIFEHKFEGFIENTERVEHKLTNTNYKVNKEYKVWFFHAEADDYVNKINRRIKRLQDLLEGDNELIFIRVGHWEVHHQEELEVCGCNDCTDEYTDMLRLKDYLINNYPNLKFKIYLYGMCSKCYIPETDDGVLITKSKYDGVLP
jgi:Putative papain-like cysteine peptidase (DUF1796)